MNGIVVWIVFVCSVYPLRHSNSHNTIIDHHDDNVHHQPHHINAHEHHHQIEPALLAPSLECHQVPETRVFRNGAVASEHPTCSDIGRDLLQAGGSAVDAAIGALVCTGVINSFSAGLGGGGFMLVSPSIGAPCVIDYRETAPLAAVAALYGRNTSLTVQGGLSVAVPGQIMGFAMAHERFGRLPWAELFRGSIDLAIRGFPVTPKLATMISKFAGELKRSPELRKAYFKARFSSDSPVPADWIPRGLGDTIHRPDLAQTLKAIAGGGVDAFYKGPIAEDMVQAVQAEGGLLSLEDLAVYRAIQRPSVGTSFLGMRVETSGAPTSGPAILLVLRILEHLRLNKVPDEADRIHLLIEALKFGYAARLELGDPAYAAGMAQLQDQIIDRAAVLAGRIDHDRTHSVEHYLSDDLKVLMVDCRDRSGTTHVSVIDDQGMAVGVTDTINLEFGSRIVGGASGVLMNNEMGDFSLAHVRNPFDLPPSEANFIAPGKRPMSSSTPLILTNSTHRVVIGGAGGSRIISSTMQSLFNLLVLGKSPWEAIVMPRLHHQLCPNEVESAILDKLRAKGHKIRVLPKSMYLSSVNMVIEEIDSAGDGRRIMGVSDPRKGGRSSGF